MHRTHRLPSKCLRYLEFNFRYLKHSAHSETYFANEHNVTGLSATIAAQWECKYARSTTMEATQQQFTLGERRSLYADELRVVAGLTSVPLLAAFATVARENFLGEPPWQIASGLTLHSATYRLTSSVSDLYHDVFVALKPDQFLNNGQPSMIAKLLEALQLGPGKRVLHIGCGSGYYTAIMAEIVGQSGSVLALEVDEDLAVAAADNLKKYPQVQVLQRDGAGFEPSMVDAILVSAGVTHPDPLWFQSLAEGGILVLPLRVGRVSSNKDTVVTVITRYGNHFAAELLTLMNFYPSPSLSDPALQAQLNACLESHRMLQLASFRIDEHAPDPTCLLHGTRYCLSAQPVL